MGQKRIFFIHLNMILSDIMVLNSTLILFWCVYWEHGLDMFMYPVDEFSVGKLSDVSKIKVITRIPNSYENHQTNSNNLSTKIITQLHWPKKNIHSQKKEKTYWTVLPETLAWLID